MAGFVSIARRGPTLAVALLALVQAGCGGGQTYLSIGTGGTGGIYYPFGGALASRMSARDPAREYTAEVSGASVENIKRLQQDQIELGFGLTSTIVGAFTGTSEEFPEPVADLRIVAPMWPQPVNLLVRGGSDIRSLYDVRGRRVAVGPAGSGTALVSRDLLEAHGLSLDDIQAQYLTFSESASAIRDGSVDLAIVPVGYPAAAILEATTQGDVDIIPLAGPQIDSLVAAKPFYYESVIPAGVYRGQDEDIPTIFEMNWIMARESLDPSVVKLVLDVLVQDREQLDQVNDIIRQIDLEMLRSPPIPVHPAVTEWLAENLPEAGTAETQTGR